MPGRRRTLSCLSTSLWLYFSLHYSRSWCRELSSPSSPLFTREGSRLLWLDCSWVPSSTSPPHSNKLDVDFFKQYVYLIACVLWLLRTYEPVNLRIRLVPGVKRYMDAEKQKVYLWSPRLTELIIWSTLEQDRIINACQFRSFRI